MHYHYIACINYYDAEVWPWQQPEEQEGKETSPMISLWPAQTLWSLPCGPPIKRSPLAFVCPKTNPHLLLNFCNLLSHSITSNSVFFVLTTTASINGNATRDSGQSKQAKKPACFAFPLTLPFPNFHHCIINKNKNKIKRAYAAGR